MKIHPSESQTADSDTCARALSVFLLLFYCMLLLFIAIPNKWAIQPDTGFSKVWSEEIRQFGRAFYTIDETSSGRYRLLTVSVPKPLVIAISLVCSLFSSSTLLLRLLSIMVWCLSLWGLCVLANPKGLVSTIILVIPFGLSGCFIQWSLIAQASIFCVATVIGALICFSKSQEGPLRFSYLCGILLMLGGLARPAVWAFTIIAVSWTLLKSRFKAVHHASGLAIGLSAPVIWILTDLLFSGDPGWSSFSARVHWGKALSTFNRWEIMSHVLVRYWMWLTDNLGILLVVMAAGGLIVLLLRRSITSILMILSVAEISVFLFSAAKGIAGFAPRFLPITTLTLLFSAGKILSMFYEIMENWEPKVFRLLSILSVIIVVFSMSSWTISGLRVSKEFEIREFPWRKVGDIIEDSIMENDLIVMPGRFIPLMADRLKLYPMVKWFRAAEYESNLQYFKTYHSADNIWLLIPESTAENSKDKGVIKNLLAFSKLTRYQKSPQDIEIYGLEMIQK